MTRAPSPVTAAPAITASAKRATRPPVATSTVAAAVRRKKATYHVENNSVNEVVPQSNQDIPSSGFLSNAVRKYLELGRAIPGKCSTLFLILIQS